MQLGHVYDLKVHTDGRGNLAAIESTIDVPFEFKRIYYLYGVPDIQSRGAHAHRDLEQIAIAVSGRFEIVLDNGESKVVVGLDNPNKALYIPKMCWRVLQNFSVDAVCLVIASAHYNEDDYFRNYEDFKRALNE
jgi:dTDP-4-dehydrorhamnose 3,5-epimerase-like enzyme